MQQQLLMAMQDVLLKAKPYNIILKNEKEIPYGVKLDLIDNKNNKIHLNIYFSKKKGISYVIGAAKTNPLRGTLESILGLQQTAISTSEHNFKLWLGTDESGKGDFFGSLVVAGFLAEKNDIPELKKLNVIDSKKLNDKDIVKIARKLYQMFPNKIEVLLLKPEKYNELYQKFANQNKKLNEMLAWMHARVIMNIKTKHNFDGVVVDKFASEKTLFKSLKGLDELNIKLVEKGESDPAVAAASIIARFHFVQNLESLSKKYELELPKGASKKVIETAKMFAKKYGKENLANVAKLHFKTLQEV